MLFIVLMLASQMDCSNYVENHAGVLPNLQAPRKLSSIFVQTSIDWRVPSKKSGCGAKEDGEIQTGQPQPKGYPATVSTRNQKTGTVYRKVRTVHCQNVFERVEERSLYHSKGERWYSCRKSTVFDTDGAVLLDGLPTKKIGESIADSVSKIRASIV